MTEVLIIAFVVGAIWWVVKVALGRSASNEVDHTDAEARTERAAGDSSWQGIEEGSSFEIGDTFFFMTSRSPNGRYLVGAGARITDDGNRKKKGACALKDLRTGEVCFKATITRAHNPSVSNDGQVVVEDWKDSPSLSGALIAFNRAGERLWARHFKANVDRSGMSADGRHAFISTCNADHEPHSGKTFFLDVSTGETLWERKGWGDERFEGDVVGAELRTDKEVLFFPFDEEGQLPPEYLEVRERIEEERGRGKYWWALPRAQAALKKGDVEAARSFLSGLDAKDSEIPKSNRAKLLRFRGEAAEADGDTAAALELWRQALALDPKVGIKRRYEALAKKTSE